MMAALEAPRRARHVHPVWLKRRCIGDEGVARWGLFSLRVVARMSSETGSL
jgi:hypothetical protein